MKKGLLFLVCGLCTAFLFAQSPLIKQWDNRFGSTFGTASFMSFEQTSDGGYILGGSSGAVVGGDQTQASKGQDDFWVVKIDAGGKKQWDVIIGGSDYDYLREIKQTQDHGYILAGYTKSRISGDVTKDNWDTTSVTYVPQHPPDPPVAVLDLTYDYWIVKIDSAGNKQWDKRYGGLKNDELYSLSPTTDGGYILGGTSYSGIGGDKTMDSRGSGDYWVVKVDSHGDKQWDKRFGGTSLDLLAIVQQTTDDGFILGGTSSSGANGDKTDTSWGDRDYWIVKLDVSGNKVWDKRFGGTSGDLFYSMQETVEGGYILGGYSASPISGDKTQSNWGVNDYWIVKINSSGEKLWDKRYGGDAYSYFRSIIQTKDNGYLLCGDIDGTSGVGYGDMSAWHQSFVYGSGGGVIWLVKTDGSGNKLWDKPISLKAIPLWSHAIQTLDGGIAIATSTSADTSEYVTVPNPDDFNIFPNYWIIKFADTSFYVSPDILQFFLFPNPTTDQLNITIDESLIGAQLNIYNVTGALVQTAQLQTQHAAFNTQQFPSGVYIAEIKTREASVKRKWVKM